MKEAFQHTNFEILFTTYRDKVYNLAFKMTADTNLAEDITQETFIKCYEKLDSYRGESQIYTWLYAIARNICLRHLEKQQRSTVQNLEQLIQEVSDEPDDDIKPEQKNNYVQQIKEGCLLGLLKTL
jgi:RNA polymerase sigma-70 factor, ECF subfamily